LNCFVVRYNKHKYDILDFMRTPEIEKIYNKGVDWALGVVGVIITNRRLRKVIYDGQENILKINENLGKGHSVLLVADHFGDDETRNDETLFSAGFMLRLNNRKTSGIFIRKEIVSGEMGLRGRTIAAILARHKIEPLVVVTPKYESDASTRTNYNVPPVQRSIKILGKPNGLVMDYSSGTRNPVMFEAEDGLPFISAFADWVVPMTTVIENDAKPKIVIHKPIPGKTGVRRCMKEFEREAGRQTYSDLVMNIIATGQPDSVKRGFYREQAGQLENYMRDPTGFTPRFEDERTQKMMTAYIIWRAGGFERVREK